MIRGSNYAVDPERLILSENIRSKLEDPIDLQRARVWERGTVRNHALGKSDLAAIRTQCAPTLTRVEERGQKESVPKEKSCTSEKMVRHF